MFDSAFVFGELLPALNRGLMVSIALIVPASIIGFAGGLALGCLRGFGSPWMRRLGDWYTAIVRGVPLAVQLMMIYFALPKIGIYFEPYGAALLSFIICSAAYHSEYVRGALLSISQGQIKAARALGFTTLQIGVNTILTQWPAATVGEFLDTLAADGEATPLPALPNPVNFYQVDDYASYGIYYIYAYGEDQVDAYVQVLLDAGFTAAAYIDGEFYYGDPKGDYLVNVAYDPDYGTTDIYLSAWEDNYVTEWPADTIADQLEVYSPESTAVLPEPTFDWQFGTMYVFVEDGSFNIDLIDLADDGTFVPHADEYAAQLNAADSGWTYDATKEAWFDATGKVMVTVFDDPDYGTSIYMESVPYVDTYAELGVDETLAGLGITKTIPALDGAAYYEDLSGDSALQFLAYGVDQADYDAYVAALEGEGYLHGYHPDFGTLYWDAELSLTIQVVFDDESGTIGVLVQNGEIWGYTDTKLDNATMFLSLLLGVTVPHFPVEAKTPVYFTTGIEEWFVGYVFATGFIAEYETALLAAGYVKDETPVAGTTASYSFATSSKVYSLQITEDVANNCTEIVVL